MSVRRARNRSTRTAALATAVLIAALIPSVVPAAAAPSFTLEERSLAIASPSLVYVELVYTGYLRSKKDHRAVQASPITYNRRCTGFVVNPDGDALTSSRCVAPGDDAVLSNVARIVGHDMMTAGTLTAAGLDAFIANAVKNDEFTGLDPANPADKQLFVQFNVATGALVDGAVLPATITAAVGQQQGGLGLIKISKTGLPVVELAPTDVVPAAGSSIQIIGFATSDPDPRTGTYLPQSKTVQVSGPIQQDNASPKTRVTADVGISSHGGMAIDNSGHVIGLIEADPTQSGSPNRGIVPVATLKEFLSASKVENKLGPADQAYRAAMDAYFSGKYSAAVEQFDVVVKDQPENQTAATYRQQALDREKIEGSTSDGLPGWLVIVLAAVGGALVIGVVVLIVVLLSRRSRRSEDSEDLLVPVSFNPFAPSSGMPASGVPMSGPPSPPVIPVQAPPGTPIPSPPVLSPRTVEPQPAAEPVFSEPVFSEPVFPEPVSAQPVSAQPVSAQPVSAQPVSAQPVSAQPVSAQPVSAQPVSGQPVSGQPVSPPPFTVQPFPTQPFPTQAESPFAAPVTQPATPSQPEPTVAADPPPADEPVEVEHHLPVLPVLPVAPPAAETAARPVEPKDLWEWPEDVDPVDSDPVDDPWSPHDNRP